VKLARPGRPPLWLLLYPLRARSSLRQSSRGARVLAVFHDSEARVRLEPRLLVQLHGLTPTEAALASALAEGRTLSEFARARGCSEQTARTHLKHVLDKTGTRRQAELVRNLLASATLHSLE
jgi:DNA-binding CsgD family transcriptional regulator